ncbi:MAG TPA: PAS domain S-box protein [Sphingomonas sp.]|nr:PAS domain S-box protein [Sphingomonas sp.]
MTNDQRDRRIEELEREAAGLREALAGKRAAYSARLRAIADAIPAMISYVDAGQRFRFCNRIYEEWFGLPLADIVDRPITELMTPATYAVRRPYVERALAGERVTYEAVFPHASGPRHTVIHHVPHVEDGAVLGFYALVQDVSEQWRALETARESEARFRRIADSAPIPMWLTAPDRTRAFVNIAYMKFLDLPFEEACRFDWRTILHEEDHDRILAESLAGEASGERFELEARYRRADGAWRWIRSISQPRFDAEGMPEGFVGVAEDITEAKRAEAAARTHAEDLKERVDRRTRERDRVWDLSQDPIVVCDRAGVWRSASPAWAAVLGWPIDRLLGRTSEWLEHPDDRAAADAGRAGLADGVLLRGFTSRLRCADGSYRWLSWNGVFEGDYCYCIARDVTEDRERAEALRIAEDALRQSQKMEALGQLTGGVAHDFNNLLTPILGALDLLARRTEDDRSARLIDGALQSATRARTLVQRLLAFARRQPLEPRSLAIDALVGGMVQLLESTVGGAITLDIRIDPDLPPALGDANQIEMALLNLAVNAHDAMPDGGTLTIALSARDILDAKGNLEPGRYVSIAVGDTGAGMDEETRRRAVEPFFSTKGLGSGTGLGLSMVHGLAGQLGGALRIDSAPGHGTTVELLLPATAAEDMRETAAQDDADATTAPLKVLLVDDEPLVRASTAAMLQAMRHDVIECASGAEALQAIEDGYAPDLLVTDQVMPHMMGDRLAALVRAHRPAARALIISGFRGAAVDTGSAGGWLAKPFRAEELAAAIGAVMRG